VRLYWYGILYKIRRIGKDRIEQSREEYSGIESQRKDTTIINSTSDIVRYMYQKVILKIEEKTDDACHFGLLLNPRYSTLVPDSCQG